MREEVLLAFFARMAFDMERLALQMTLEGKFLSDGWTVGYRLHQDGAVMSYELFPLPPRSAMRTE